MSEEWKIKDSEGNDRNLSEQDVLQEITKGKIGENNFAFEWETSDKSKKKNGDSDSIIDKDNYVKSYSLEERCVNGDLPDSGLVIDESSGSSGLPTNWVRGEKERNGRGHRIGGGGGETEELVGDEFPPGVNERFEMARALHANE